VLTATVTVQLNHSCLLTVSWTYYQDVLLTSELLPATHSIVGDVFVFHQDNAPAHRARDTVELLRRETPQFISPDVWPANSRDLNPLDCCICGMLQTRVYQYQSTIRTSCGSGLLRHGLNFSDCRAWWTMRLISGEKDSRISAGGGHFEQLP